jgi:regulator of protease activity HflC (stomatin/prohibitin superfamily)
MLLFLACGGFLACAAGLIVYDIYLAFELGRLLRWRQKQTEPGAASDAAALPPAPVVPRVRRAIRWNTAGKLVAAAALSIFLGKSIVVVPDGHAGVRVSQLSGVRPGTLYPGTHLVFPLTERVVLYDIRDQVFQTAAAEGPKIKEEVLTVEAREGLSVGIGVTVRYRLDPGRLNTIQANLPQPIEGQIVEPVVTSVFRELGPDYVVRDVFSVKREEFRKRAAEQITSRLGEDGIIVKEVLLRKVQLPEEYARGLEGLLMKEQEDDRFD